MANGEFYLSLCTIYHNISLKTLVQQGISEPVFYGGLVCKIPRTVGKPSFSDQFKKMITSYESGIQQDIMRQFVCLAINLITVFSYGFLFNCTTVGQT